MTDLQIKRLTTSAEFDACVDLQQQTWQYVAGESLPRRVFFLAEKLGGHVLGAYDGGLLAGFNLGLPAQRNGVGYIHSQMLAVLPQFRNSGLGRRMKLAQREIALAQKIRLIEWTYDPLEIKNSFFNLHRLGAISRRYHADFYGASSSPLQGGLPTDRLVAAWWIGSDRVERILDGKPIEDVVVAEVDVSAEIYRWKEQSDSRAREAQSSVREALMRHFASGFAVIDYRRGTDGGGSFLIGPAPQELVQASSHTFQETA